MNIGTKAVLSSAAVGVGVWGYKQLGWNEKKTDESDDPDAILKEASDDSTTDTASAFKTAAVDMIRTSACATAAGWFQVYSGGIVIDSVATRLQAGMSMNQSLWGLKHADTPLAKLVSRYCTRVAAKTHGTYSPGAPQIYGALLMRSNLFAGHFVTMLGRFPYLFLNFTTYQQTENLLFWRRSWAAQPDGASFSSQAMSKTVPEEVICVSASTFISTAAITVTECPKIIDQVGGSCGQRTTVMGVLRAHGVQRLLQGYTACFMREYLFNTALLTSPALATVLQDRFVTGRRGIDGAAPGEMSTRIADILSGREIVFASLGLGLPLGILTNGPDQLKTNIQTGQFLNMREAWAHQRKYGNGLRGLYGKAALYRGLYIAHCVVAFNFARDRVERYIAGYI